MRSSLLIGILSVTALVFATALPSDSTAQEKEACNLVHVPVIKEVLISYDGTKSIEITANGEVPTSGYKDHVLVRRVYVVPPADGIWEYDMFSCKPSGIVSPVVTAVAAKAKWDSPPRSLKGIRVYGSTEPKEVPIKWPTK